MRDFIPIDEILAWDPHTLHGRKGFSGREPYFEAHFPKYPVVPGTYLLEGLCECIRWWTELRSDFAETVAVRGVKGAQFTRFVRPGDRVTLRVALQGEVDRLRTFRGECRVDGDVIGHATLTTSGMAVKDPAYAAHRRGVFRYLWHGTAE